MPELEKVVTTALGVGLGFLFGILSLYVKERVDFQRRASQARYAFLFLVSELSQNIQFDPSKYDHVTIDIVIPYLDVISNSDTLKRVLDVLRPALMHWKNKEYFDMGVRVNEAIAQYNELRNFVAVLEHFKPGIFVIR